MIKCYMYSIILFSLLFSAMTNSLKRQVFIHEYYNGCSDDRGWFMLKDYDSTSGCTQWDVVSNDMPYFFYSGDSTNINMETGMFIF